MINEYNEEHVWTVLCLEQSQMFFLAFLVCFFSVFVFVCMFGSSIWVERQRKPLRARREAMGTRAAALSLQSLSNSMMPTKTYQYLPRRIEDAAVQYATVTIRLSNSVRPALDLLMWDFNRLAIWIDDVWYSNVTVKSWNFCGLKRRRCRRLCVQSAR